MMMILVLISMIFKEESGGVILNGRMEGKMEIGR